MSRRNTGPAWVYRVFDTSGRLIYVGATTDLNTRLENHALNRWWGPQIAKVKAKVYPTVGDARNAERDAIATERPRWNIHGRHNARISWTREDYCDYVLARSRYREHELDWTRRHLDRIRAEYERRFGEPFPALLLPARESAA